MIKIYQWMDFKQQMSKKSTEIYKASKIELVNERNVKEEIR